MNNPDTNLEAVSSSLKALKNHVTKHLLGQSEVVEQVMVAMLAGGHVLIEGVPGLGKTLLVQALASGIGGAFKRIQFTPDLMPGDVTGHVMFDMAQSKFILKQGPVFTNLLLADEINRAPAKTQAALLEVMQEYQVTLDGRTLKIKKPFMVLATQNPIEQEGTYALPEAELDRFVMKINIDYPSATDEVLLATRHASKATSDIKLNTENLIDVSSAQQLCAGIDVDQRVAEYAVQLVRETRSTTLLRHGAGPRASIALLKCAKAVALMNGEHFVTPDDVKSMALAVLRHRVILAPEVEIDGLNVNEVLRTLLEKVDAPRS
jgi:MoxR-like ATPase